MFQNLAKVNAQFFDERDEIRGLFDSPELAIPLGVKGRLKASLDKDRRRHAGEWKS